MDRFLHNYRISQFTQAVHRKKKQNTKFNIDPNLVRNEIDLLFSQKFGNFTR